MNDGMLDQFGKDLDTITARLNETSFEDARAAFEDVKRQWSRKAHVRVKHEIDRAVSERIFFASIRKQQRPEVCRHYFNELKTSGFRDRASQVAMSLEYANMLKKVTGDREEGKQLLVELMQSMREEADRKSGCVSRALIEAFEHQVDLY